MLNIPSTILVNNRIKATIKAITIKIIFFILFIKNKEFTINLNLVYILLDPQVYLTPLFAYRDTDPPVVGVVMPLLFSISHDVSVSCRHTEGWRRSKDSEPGWAAECHLRTT